MAVKITDKNIRRIIIFLVQRARLAMNAERKDKHNPALRARADEAYSIYKDARYTVEVQQDGGLTFILV